MTEAEAAALIERYLELHNDHSLDEVMNLYAEDAVFQLNGGRPLVEGRENIRELERFDSYARSHLQPYGLAYQREGNGWVVHIAGVIEHSSVFSALGMTIVQAQPVRRGFVLRDRRIAAVVQPELNPACSAIAVAGFGKLARWLTDTNDYRSPALVVGGRLAFEPQHIPLIVAAIRDWRIATGWRPKPNQVRACAVPSGLS